MRIWHEKLIPKLCRQHLLGCWREGLGMMSILHNGKKGYLNHPATKEFIDGKRLLAIRMNQVRQEMLKRGYKPKELPKYNFRGNTLRVWQSLATQKSVLKAKGCECHV